MMVLTASLLLLLLLPPGISTAGGRGHMGGTGGRAGMAGGAGVVGVFGVVETFSSGGPGGIAGRGLLHGDGHPGHRPQPRPGHAYNARGGVTYLAPRSSHGRYGNVQRWHDYARYGRGYGHHHDKRYRPRWYGSTLGYGGYGSGYGSAYGSAYGSWGYGGHDHRHHDHCGHGYSSSYVRKRDYAYHQRRHGTVIIPGGGGTVVSYYCNVCGVGFASEALYQAHLTRLHPNGLP